MSAKTILGSLLILILALAAPALAFECPPPDQLVQQGGKWTAPGGWVQSDYAAPIPQARIKGRVDATYLRPNMEPLAWLQCLYRVENQPGVTYTSLRNRAPLVDFLNVYICMKRMPNYDCDNLDNTNYRICAYTSSSGCEIKDQ